MATRIWSVRWTRTRRRSPSSYQARRSRCTRRRRTASSSPIVIVWRGKSWALPADDLTPFLLRGTLPHHAGEALQRNERLAEIRPVLHLGDGNLIARLPSCAAAEERARYVDHLRRVRPFVDERRSASGAEAPCPPGRLFLKACDLGFALGHPEAAAPAADVGRIGRTMRPPARAGMVVPRPPRGNADLDLHGAAKTLARCACLFLLTLRLVHAGPHRLEAIPGLM